MEPLETYLSSLSSLRASGSAVPETSGYGALATSSTRSATTSSPRCAASSTSRTAAPASPTAASSSPTSSRRAPRAAARPAAGARRPRGQAADADVRAVAAERAGAPLPREVPPGPGHHLPRVRARGLRRRRAARGCSRATRSPTPSSAFWTLATHAAQGRRPARRAPRRVPASACMLRQAQIAAPQDLAWFLASLRARGSRPRRGARPARPGDHARRARGGARHEVRGREGRALLPLDARADAVLRPLRRLGLLGRAPRAHRRAGALPLARGGRATCTSRSCRSSSTTSPTPPSSARCTSTRCSTGPARRSNRVDRASFFANFEQQPRRAVLLRAVPRGVRPRAAQGARASGTRRPRSCSYMVARVDQVLRSGAGHRRRPGRSARRRPRPLLRHRRLPRRGARHDRRHAARARATTLCSRTTSRRPP